MLSAPWLVTCALAFPQLGEQVTVSLRSAPAPTRATPVSFGPAAEARWFSRNHLFVAVLIGVGYSREANEFWQFRRLAVPALVGGGVQWPVGVGTIFAAAHLGLEPIWERKTRQDVSRLESTPQTTPRWRYSLGACASAELGVSVMFLTPFSVTAAIGPAYSRHRIQRNAYDSYRVTSDGDMAYTGRQPAALEQVDTVALHSRLGLSYDF